MHPNAGTSKGPMWTPEKLLERVEYAIEQRDKCLAQSRDLWRLFQGQPYDREFGEDTVSIAPSDNIPYELVQNITATLIDGVPQVWLYAAEPGDVDEEIADDAAALNQWAHNEKLDGALETTATDGLFDFGPVRVGLKVTGESDIPELMRLTPCIEAIAPDRFIIDPANPNGPGFVGEQWYAYAPALRDAKDDKGKPVYDTAMIDSLSSMGLPDTFSAAAPGTDDGPEQDIVCGYEILSLEDWHIYTLGHIVTSDRKGRVQFLRPPRPYTGIREGLGCYVMFKANDVRHSVFGLAPLVALKGDIDEVNIHSATAAGDAARAIKLFVFSSEMEEIKRAVESGERWSIVPVENFNKNEAEVYEWGGPSEATLLWIDRRRGEMRRKLGMSEARSGDVTGAGTAYENSVAEAGLSTRVRRLQKRFSECVRQIFRIALHYLRHTEGVEFGVRQTDPSTDETRTGIYVGGAYAEYDIGAVVIELQPLSMEYVEPSVRQQRMERAFEFLGKLGEMVISQPWTRPGNIANDFFAAFNIPRARDRYLDIQVIELMRQAQLKRLLAGILPGDDAAGGAPGGGEPGSAGVGAGGGAGGGGGRAPSNRNAAEQTTDETSAFLAQAAAGA